MRWPVAPGGRRCTRQRLTRYVHNRVPVGVARWTSFNYENTCRAVHATTCLVDPHPMTRHPGVLEAELESGSPGPTRCSNQPGLRADSRGNLEALAS